MDEVRLLGQELLTMVKPILGGVLGIDPQWAIALLLLLIWIRLGGILRNTGRTARILGGSGFFAGTDGA